MTWPDGRGWTASLGSLHIQAVTSDGTPARGTVIRLDGTDYTGTADSTGAIAIGDLIPGSYTASVLDPALLRLGLGLPTDVRFVAQRDSVTRFTVRVPTIRDVVGDACRTAGTPIAGGAWMLARIMTPGGAPIGDAQWSIHPGGGQDSTAAPVPSGKTTADGLLHVCGGLPPGALVEIRIRADRYEQAHIQVELSNDMSVVPILLLPARR
jgi:hypothetical protein